jgi:tetratricopeptide (TPR) repeat protein
VRNRDWRDSESLWRSTVAAAPRSARGHNNLGVVQAQRRQYPQALASFREAVRIRPEYVEARIRLADLLGFLGDKQEMIRELGAALEHNKRRTPPPMSNGFLLYRLGRFEEASQELRNELARSPHRLPPRMWLALSLDGLGQYDAALPEWQRYLALRPDDVAAHLKAAETARKAGRHDLAREWTARAKGVGRSR